MSLSKNPGTGARDRVTDSIIVCITDENVALTSCWRPEVANTDSGITLGRTASVTETQEAQL